MKLKYLLLFLTASIFSATGFAKTLVSTKVSSKSKPIELNESVASIVDEKELLKIVFAKHSAFYLWDKKSSDTEAAHKYFQSSMKNNTPLKVKIDAFNQKIYSLEEPK